MATARKTIAKGRPSGSRSTDPAIAAAFGQAVLALRLAGGQSQEGLALAAGIARANLSSIETGKTAPTFVAVVKLAAAMGCSVEHLAREFERHYKRPK